MSSEIRVNLLTLEYLKKSLNIPDDNTTHNDQLVDILFIANQEVITRLTPYLGDNLFESGTEIYLQAKKAAGRYARSLWYERQFQTERAKASDEMYELKIKQLIDTIKSQKPERTESLFIPATNPADPLFEPFNIGEYITRLF